MRQLQSLHTQTSPYQHCILHGRGLDPLVVDTAHLEAAQIVLEEEGECAVVGVLAAPDQAWRHGTLEGREEKILRKALPITTSSARHHMILDSHTGGKQFRVLRSFLGHPVPRAFLGKKHDCQITDDSPFRSLWTEMGSEGRQTANDCMVAIKTQEMKDRMRLNAV